MRGKEKLIDQITEKLRNMIVDEGIFSPGEKIPSEIELSRQFCVSRTTVREAARRLEVEGLLRKKRGSGTFVAENTLSEKGGNSYDYRYTRLASLFHLRMMLEPGIAGLASQKATQEELEEIKSIAEKLEQKNITKKEMMERNEQFHNHIAAAAHNQFLLKIFENINAMLLKYMPEENLEDVGGQDALREHKMISEYLSLREKRGSEEVMRFHLQSSMKAFHVDETDKLADQKTVNILEMITIGHRFMPGDQIPIEEELTKELGVSRTTVRDAINNLVSQGIFEKVQGKGTYVVPNEELYSDMGFDRFDGFFISLPDFYELRLILEPQAAALAAQKATDEELKKICSLGKKLQEKNLSRKEILRRNQKFHNAIAKATHNEFIIRLFGNINTAVVKDFNEIPQDAPHEIILKTHELLIEYLVAREKKGAFEAMRLHLIYSFRLFS